MNRREAIKRTTILLGGTLSASAILGVMSGCQADPVLNWTPSFFTVEEGGIVESIVERIIPKTETPGAIDAGVHTFIDNMMANFYPASKSLDFRNALSQVNEDAKSGYGKPFTSLSESQQDELLGKYDEQAFGNSPDAEHFFRTMKELTVLGFFTSDIGATEVLEYDPVPGDYKGCIPYDEVGKAWAT